VREKHCTMAHKFKRTGPYFGELLAPGRPEQMSVSLRIMLSQPARLVASAATPYRCFMRTSVPHLPHTRTPLLSASPCPAHAPWLRPPLLPPDPLLSLCGRDPGAQMIGRPQVRRAPHVPAPAHFPSAWVVPHDSLNIHLKHETLII
jgi:hypothetical protein